MTNIAVLFQALLAFAPPTGAQLEESEANRLFSEAKAMILSEYYDDRLKEPTLTVSAVRGMVEGLNDDTTGEFGRPNTLLSPAELGELQGDLKGEVVGIGVEIDFDKPSGMVVVKGIIPGSPAQNADLRAGDRILAIDGASFRGRELRDVARAIRGRAGTPVKLAVLREASVLEKRAVRAQQQLPSVLHTRDGDVGLLTIRLFHERTPAEIETALRALATTGVRKLIVDLRGNGGGLFEKMVEAAELLVPRAAEIVRSIGRGGKTKRYTSRRDPLLRGLSLVVMVDAQTASSAEILAEALRVDLGATLIGTRTFGKWRMETLRALSGGYALKFTIALLQSPRGESFDRKGLTPDLEVAPGAEPLDHTRRIQDVRERAGRDPQLKAALQVARLRG
jgi:carboxyl-terminal processing protease